MNGANAHIDMSPTGTGHVSINPTGVGDINNVIIGATTPKAITGTTITATTFSGSGASLTSIPNSALVNSTISGVALGGSLFNLTAGTGVSFSTGTTYNGSAAITINATGTGGTVTSVAALTLGTTGTDLSSTVANGTTTPVITLNVPTASASNRGALSSTDWSTFNGKQAALVSGTNIKTVSGVSLLGSGDVGTIGVGYGGTGQTSFTAGRVLYGNGASAIASSANLFFDGANLGIGTSSPSQKLDIDNGSSAVRIRVASTGSVNSDIAFYNGLNSCGVGVNGSGNPFFYTGGAYAMQFSTNATQRMQIGASGGVSIGNTTDPGATNLSVTGTGKFGTTVGVGAATPSASGAGITFPATQSASTDANTLDDYEEGTFTPVVADAATGGNTGTAALAKGRYTKIGRLVTVTIAFLDINTTGMTAGNSLHVRGLPFTSITDAFVNFCGSQANSQLASTNGAIYPVLGNNSSAIYFLNGVAAGSNTAITVAGVTSGATDLYITLTYEAA
jgi:hypothetical protein